MISSFRLITKKNEQWAVNTTFDEQQHMTCDTMSLFLQPKFAHTASIGIKRVIGSLPNNLESIILYSTDSSQEWTSQKVQPKVKNPKSSISDSTGLS